MARIFDIRFARKPGLAALFEAPANSFRWKGWGRLSIDDQWLVFARRRPFSWLFSHPPHRVPVAALSSVYREGDALRLEFAGTPQLVVPIWANTRADAAEIVRLVPTDRTVELDATEPRVPVSSRPRGAFALVALGVLIGIAVTLAVVGNRRASDALPPTPAPAAVVAVGEGAPPTTGPSAAADRNETRIAGPAEIQQAGVSEASSSTQRDAAVLAPDEMLNERAPPEDERAYARLRGGDAASVVVEEPNVVIAPPRSDFFRAEALALRSEYVYGRTLPEDLESRWWALSVRLYESPEFEDRRWRALVDAQLGVSLNWRASLTGYAAALASGDRARIDAARAELENASELTDRVVRFSD
jgi:hypothetical protein